MRIKKKPVVLVRYYYPISLRAFLLLNYCFLAVFRLALPFSLSS
uniref:Uncharacterized protein n=1 Tax=CrAss-like virus sp. ctUXy6 TaxID=2825835 RepID=A0A8S5V7D7_9CAUD|nr:MAG TPA: hypothetical protein [CrAss-like virus sp. ctUXy6]